VHNHHSGNNDTLEADITITKKIVEADKLFDIAVLVCTKCIGKNWCF